jgi:hypothetical protein
MFMVCKHKNMQGGHWLQRSARELKLTDQPAHFLHKFSRRRCLTGTGLGRRPVSSSACLRISTWSKRTGPAFCSADATRLGPRDLGRRATGADRSRSPRSNSRGSKRQTSTRSWTTRPKRMVSRRVRRPAIDLPHLRKDGPARFGA